MEQRITRVIVLIALGALIVIGGSILDEERKQTKILQIWGAMAYSQCMAQRDRALHENQFLPSCVMPMT